VSPARRTRTSVPAQVRREVMLEAGHRCAMPRCTHEIGLELHHIDGNPANSTADNLIVLCAVHHAEVTAGGIDRKSVEFIKSRLSLVQRPLAAQALGSRKSLMQESRAALSESASFRTQVVGPVFLHPSWWWERRNRAIQLPSFEQDVWEFCIGPEAANREVRLIFTFSPRYLQKVEEFVAYEDRDRFVDDVLSQCDLVWDDAGAGPDLCCVNTGFGHVLSVFDHAVITSFRAAPNLPLNSGHISRDPLAVADAKERFDTIFDATAQGRIVELEAMRRTLRTLWSSGTGEK
jgi:hypothetical protein